jgi:hypothetical protein
MPVLFGDIMAFRNIVTRKVGNIHPTMAAPVSLAGRVTGKEELQRCTT